MCCKRQTVPMFPWVVAHLLSEAKATDMRVYSPKIRNCWLSVRQINYKNKRGLLLADSSQEQFCVLLYEQYRRSIKLINLCVIRQFVHLPNCKYLYFSVHNSIQFLGTRNSSAYCGMNSIGHLSSLQIYLFADSR